MLSSRFCGIATHNNDNSIVVGEGLDDALHIVARIAVTGQCYMKSTHVEFVDKSREMVLIPARQGVVASLG